MTLWWNTSAQVWQRLGYFKNMKKNWLHASQNRPGAYLSQRPPKVSHKTVLNELCIILLRAKSFGQSMVIFYLRLTDVMDEILERSQSSALLLIPS